MVKFSCYTVNKVRWILAVNPHLTHATEGGETDLRPRKGGAVMILTFVSTWDIGDLLSAAQLIVTLFSLYWANRKK